MAFAHRRVASVGARRSAGMITGGALSATGFRAQYRAIRVRRRDRPPGPQGVLPDGGVDAESGARPRQHAGGLVLVEQIQVDEEPEHGTAKRFGHTGRVVGRPRDERPVRPEAAVGDEQVPVRRPVGAGAMRWQTRDESHREVTLAGQRTDGGGHGVGGHAGDLAEQATPVQTVGAEPLGDGEHDLPVRHRREQCRVQPLGPNRSALGVTARTEVAALAGDREQVFVRARVAANCAQTRGRGCRRRGTGRSPARPRGATGRTRARSARRRPSAGDAGGLTPTERVATLGGGFVDATSAWRRPNGAYCRRASSDARSARIVLERPLQKPALKL